MGRRLSGVWRCPVTNRAIALGTAQLGMAYGVANRRGMLSKSQAESILQTAIDLEVLVWDTAPGYGCSETRIGEFLRRVGRPDGLELFTKLPRLPDGLTGPEVAVHVARSVEDSRSVLECERLGGLLVHHVADLARYGGALVDALCECQRLGWVDRVGVSVYTAQEINTVAVRAELSAIQYPFNVFTQDAGPGATELASRGWRTFARSALAQGAVALSADQVTPSLSPWLERMTALCGRHDMSPVDAALGFALERSGADHVVLGVEDPAQLTAAVATAQRPGASELYAAFQEELAGGAQAADPRGWTRTA